MTVPGQPEGPHRQENRVNLQIRLGVNNRIELPCHFNEVGDQVDLVIVTGDDENRHVGKISILVGAEDLEQGRTSDGPGAIWIG